MQDTWFYERKEDGHATQRRAVEFAESLHEMSENTIAVVSHKVFLRHLLTAFGVPNAAQPEFDNAEMREFRLCGGRSDLAATGGVTDSTEHQEL